MKIFLKDRQGGFSLIEMLAALSIFAIVTIGLFPVLASALQGATKGRSYTVGKNVAVRAMERLRGLPYFRSVSTTTTPRKIDILDLLFPCAPGTSPTVANPCGTPNSLYVFSGGYADPLRAGAANVLPAGTFVTFCAAGALTNPACPSALPDGFSLRFDTQFVTPSTTAGAETYAVVSSTTSPALSTAYNWSSSTTEIPPVQIAKVRVTVSWSLGGDLQVYDLETLLSDKKFGIEKIAAVAKVEYGVRVLTSFIDSLGLSSDLVAVGPASESGISSRLSSLADQRTTSGSVSLTRPATGGAGAVTLLDPAPSGASSSYSAPPDQTTISDPAATVATTPVTHPSLCQNPALSTAAACERKLIGYLAPTHTKGLSVSTANDVPAATGSSLYSPTSTSTFDFFVDAQRNPNTATKNPLQLLTNDVQTSSGIDHPIFSVRPNAGTGSNADCMPTTSVIACRSMFAKTSVLTGALSGGTNRRVQATAETGFAQMRLFPVAYIPGAQGASKSVFQIDNFTARVDCKATGLGTSTDATARWSATVRYWRETDTNNGSNNDGGYVTDTWTESNFGSKIAALKTAAGNPMVYEVPESTAIKLPQQGDVYLFPKSDLQGVHPSYFTDITGGVGSVTRDTQAGQTATAKIAGALTFSTAAIDPDVPQSGMNIVLGSLSCSAADRRT